MNAPPCRVLLVDDHAVVRAGYRRLLDDEAGLHVVGECADADEAYAALGKGPIGAAADLLVLDLSMPGRGGLDLIRRVALRWPALRVLVFSMHEQPALVARALQAGAAGYVTKSSAPEVLVQAVQRVAAGEERVLSPDLERALAQPVAQPPHASLSVRELEVLRALLDGLNIEAIAQRLHMSPKTVSNHQTRIRQRLGVASAMELLRYAQAHRLFTP